MAGNSTRILVVDDEENIREMMKRLLVRSGYLCITASDTFEAAERLKNEQFGLLLMDMMMPRRSGLEYLPEVVRLYPDMAVVMLTAVVDTSTALNAIRNGAYDYVTKMLDQEVVTLRIRRALERRSLMLQNRQYQKKLKEMVAQLGQHVEVEETELDKRQRVHETCLYLQKTLAEFSAESAEWEDQTKPEGLNEREAQAEMARTIGETRR